MEDPEARPESDVDIYLVKPVSTLRTTSGATFRSQAELLFKSTWQVLQLRGTPSPGVVLAFVLIDSKVHTLKVNVLRQIFLNLKGKELPDIEVDGCEAQKDVYVNDAQKLSLLFNHPSVEGVYEKQVPLSVRAVLQLGSLCTFDETQPGVLGKGLESGFDLSSLRRSVNQDSIPVTITNGIHIPIPRRCWRQTSVCSILHSHGLAHVVILQKSKDSAQDLPNIGKIYSDMFARREQEPDGQDWQTCFTYQEKLQFKTSQVTTRRKALLEVGDLVKKMRNDETKPLMLVIQSPQRRMLVHDVPILGDFPIMPLKYEIEDSNLPPLGWQAFVAKKLVNNYLSFGSWITHLTGFGKIWRYSLCNLEREDPRFLIDIAYARRLQKNNVVLWWSGGPRPDHAGYEQDDIFGPLDTVQMPFVNNPGTYSSVCIELDIRNLAINTILTSSLINELEGSDSISFNPAAPSDDSPSTAQISCIPTTLSLPLVSLFSGKW